MTIQRLVDLMYELEAVHRSLLELSTEKTGVLIRGEVDKLVVLTNSENKLVKRITELDQRRVALIAEYATSKGFSPHAVRTVSDLIKLTFNADDRGALERAQAALLSVLNELKRLNDTNQQLLQQALTFVNYSMDLILGPEEEPVYQHPANLKQTQRAGLFDSKA